MLNMDRHLDTYHKNCQTSVLKPELSNLSSLIKSCIIKAQNSLKLLLSTKYQKRNRGAQKMNLFT